MLQGVPLAVINYVTGSLSNSLDTWIVSRAPAIFESAARFVGGMYNSYANASKRFRSGR